MFDEYGVEIVAISSDRPKDAARHRKRDGRTFEVWSDRGRSVIEEYGIL